MSSSISGDLAGEIRLLLESMGPAAEVALRPGQHLPARVIEMLLTGDALLELGQSRVTVPTSTPLQPGDRVRLEVVTAGPTPEFRIVTDTPAAETASALVTGQRIAARVLEMLSTGDVVLDLGASRAVVRASGPLQPGERVVLDVVSGGAKPELRIATDKTAVTSQAATAQPPGVAGPPAVLSPRDLPVIMRALAEMAPTGIPIAQAGQTFLRAAVAADLHPAVLEQIQRVLAPLQAALPPAELAPALRAFLAQSGLFTENHLGAALQEHPGPPTADEQPAIADVRLLLGALTTAGTPVPDPVRVFGEALLQQQLVVAEQLAATSSAQMTIPFVFGEERVDIRFTWDREARQDTQERSEPDDDRAISLGVFVNVNIFGAIEARIVWKPASFAVTFYVEREATRAIVEAGLSDLSKELSASGFSAVAMNVWLNPDRVAAGVTPVRRAIPAGTILDVMA
jgi:Flagellar hook-length control protein FliK